MVNPHRQKGEHLFVVPLELKEANHFVALHHRHHKPCVGHRFSLGCVDIDGNLRGAAIIGRPVARLAGHPREVIEVNRLVTDGTYNACSILYSAAARAAKAMGFMKIQTYILDEEPGTSLKASGWVFESLSPGGQWKHTDGKQRRTDQPTGPKSKWVLYLNQQRQPLQMPVIEDPQEKLF